MKTNEEASVLEMIEIFLVHNKLSKSISLAIPGNGAKKFMTEPRLVLLSTVN